MRRCYDPRWGEACQRVDRAASLLERTRRSGDPRVWEARKGYWFSSDLRGGGGGLAPRLGVSGGLWRAPTTVSGVLAQFGMGTPQRVRAGLRSCGEAELSP